MLILTLDASDNFVQLGDNIRIYFEALPGIQFHKKIRIKIDAPKEIRILRRKAVKREPPVEDME